MPIVAVQLATNPATDLVELSRRFDPSGRHDDLDFLRLRWLDDLPTWDEVLQNRCVIILGETGMGKTSELQARADVLAAAGLATFYLRLDELARPQGIALALPATGQLRFQAWTAGDQPGILFVDSMDEARLVDMRGISTGLRALMIALGSAAARATIVLAIRSSDWRGPEDVNAIRQELAPILVDHAQREPKVYTLAPLTEAASRTLAAANGVRDPDTFMAAMRDAGCLDLAGRPTDVKRMAKYWAATGHLGDETARMEEAATEDLRERDPKRARRQPLTPERARAAAEVLGAALVLGQAGGIWLGGQGSAPPGTLDPTLLLPDWPPAELEALFQRPIFERRADDRLHFKQRDMREYMAARWFARLCDAGESHAVKDLFFREIEATIVVPTNLRPVLPWLARIARDFLRPAIEHAPDTLLSGGDPGALSLTEKLALLRSYVRTYADRERAPSRFEPRHLQAIASPDVLAYVLKVASDRTLAFAGRNLALRLIKHGRLVGATPIADQIMQNPAEDRELRRQALRVLVALDSAPELLAFAAGDEPLDFRLLLPLLDYLYPQHLGVDGLLRLIGRLPAGYRGQDLGKLLATKARREVRPQDRLPLLAGLVQGANAETGLDGIEDPIVELMAAIVRHEPIDTLTATAMGEAAKFLWMKQADVELVREALDGSPWKAQMLWQRVGSQGFPHVTMFRHPQQGEVVHLTVVDLPWLLRAVRELEDEALRREAFLTSIVFWCTTRDHQLLADLQAVASNDPLLQEELERFTRPREPDEETEREIRDLADRDQENQASWRKTFEESLETLADPSRTGLLTHLLNWGSNRSTALAAIDWGALQQLFGADVVEAGRLGCKRFALIAEPPTDREGNSLPWEVVLALVGLDLLMEEGTVVDPDRVAAAIEFASWELNQFPAWVETVRAAFPHETTNTLRRLVTREMEGDRRPGVLGKLANSEDISRGLEPDVAGLLGRLEPADPYLLSTAIKIAMRTPKGRAEIERLASDRVASALMARVRFLPWWMAWFEANADGAIEWLAGLSRAEPAQADRIALWISSLFEPFHWRASESLKDLSVQQVGLLASLLYRHIRPEDDIHRQGAYTPGDRDDAQTLRSRVIQQLSQDPRPDAALALTAVADLPEAKFHRGLLLSLVDERRADLAVGRPWFPRDVRTWADGLFAPPTSVDDVMIIIRRRLDEYVNHVEAGDFSPRVLMKPNTHENELQKHLAAFLHWRRGRQYFIAREAEVDEGNRMDLVVGWSGTGRVVIEVKWVQKWTFEKLEAALRDQLVGQYLADQDSHHAVFLLGLQHEGNRAKRWRVGGKLLALQALAAELRRVAEELRDERPEIRALDVVTVDFSRHVGPRQRVSSLYQGPGPSDLPPKYMGLPVFVDTCSLG